MVTVVAALIEKDGKDLIARRSTGSEDVMGKWEFPGGKVKDDESEFHAIEREIEEALDRGAKGRIITSTYQNFTDIGSLEQFYTWQKEYDNFECHLDYECFGDNGFHTKGYMFEYDDSVELVVESSNITT